jgi:RsiW-degrading membrane proteinase PrsW (M82 family)
MPVLHTLAAILPGIVLMSVAWRGSLFRGRPVRGVTWRQATLCFALSMSLAAMVAGYLNSIGGFAATVLLLVHNGAFVDVASSDRMWEIIADSNFILSDTEQWIANIVAIAIIPPLVEEFFKGLGVRFMLRRNSTRAQAFALGAAAGAGFGFLEALIYGLGGISDDLAAWWEIMLIRGGSTSLHVLQTGLVGVGWWYWTIARRKSVALGLLGIAVVSHAVWNGVAVTLISQILWLETLSSRSIEVVAYGSAGGLASAFIIAIPMVARRLRDPEPATVAGTPLASMTPWIG